MGKTKYQTKPLDCWRKAKELRLNSYLDYARAHEKGGLRYSGGSWFFDAVCAGLGDDVYPLSAEPYAASCAFDPAFATQCQAAADERGYGKDLCAYLRTYLGSMFLDKYFFGGPWPKADFAWQSTICDSNTKWFQIVRDYQPDLPFYSIDISSGPYDELNDRRIKYIVDQLQDGIEWLKKVTGREYDDEKLIQAVYNYCRSTSLWAEICILNQAIPAPLDMKSMFPLFALAPIHKSSKKVADFYEEVRDEVKDRVANQIAGVGNERCRLAMDIAPPWGHLRVLRFMEGYGVNCCANAYTFCLHGSWDVLPEGTLVALKTPQQKGIELKTREQALWVMAEFEMKNLLRGPDFGARYKSDLMLRTYEQWHCDAVMLHQIRGCEGAVYDMEARRALAEAGIPLMQFQGSLADAADYDEVSVFDRIDAFLKDTMGLNKIEG